MKKQNEVRYIITAVASIPVIKLNSKTEAYKQATKPGWGTVEWYSAADNYTNPVDRDRSDKTQQLACDEDSSADLYTKDGRYFGIYPYDEINVKEMPKQAETAAIIHGDSDGWDFWTEDGTIKIFVTYDENGLVDTCRLGYGDEQPEAGETVLSFEDLYEAEGPEWDESYRADIPGTVEYQIMQEAASAAAEAQGMDGAAEAARPAQAAEDNTTQQDAGTAAEAASEGRETALGTPDKMAGTDTTTAADGQQAAPWAAQDAPEAAAMERDKGRQPGGP